MQGVMRVEGFHVIFAVKFSKVYKCKSTTSLTTLEFSDLIARSVVKGSTLRVSMRNISQVTSNQIRRKQVML